MQKGITVLAIFFISAFLSAAVAAETSEIARLLNYLTGGNGTVEKASFGYKIHTSHGIAMVHRNSAGWIVYQSSESPMTIRETSVGWTVYQGDSVYNVRSTSNGVILDGKTLSADVGGTSLYESNVEALYLDRYLRKMKR